MATIEVTLPVGFKLGDDCHQDAVLRELGTRDIIEAGIDAETCVMGPDGQMHLVRSATKAGIELLRRQIVRIGPVDGPFTLAEFFKLAPEDFLALQAKAEELDAAIAKAMEGLAARGRDQPAS